MIFNIDEIRNHVRSIRGFTVRHDVEEEEESDTDDE